MSEERNARRRLSTLPGFNAELAERARLTQLPGLTNRVFKVELGHEALCLRIAGAGTASLIDRRAEEMNARAAAQAGVAPEVVHFDADGTMLTRFVDGVPLTPAHLVKSPGALRRTAAALRTLHATAADFVGTFRAFETMERYLALVETAGQPLPVRHRHVVRLAGALRAALADRPAQLRPCHCDPTGRNILDTGERVWLVDWEYAAMNDPMWDLAYVSVEAELAGRSDLDLLTAYLGRPPHEVEAARLAVTKPVCELLAALWALVQGTQGNRIADFRAYAEQRFARAVERTEGADFARHMETLRRG